MCIRDRYRNATADDKIRMVTVISKLENQDGNRHWPGIIHRVENGAIASLDDLKACLLYTSRCV